MAGRWRRGGFRFGQVAIVVLIECREVVAGTVELLARYAAVTVAIQARDKPSGMAAGPSVARSATGPGVAVSIPSPGFTWAARLLGLPAGGLHGYCRTRCAGLGGPAADKADVVVDPLRVTLRSVSLGQRGLIT